MVKFWTLLFNFEMMIIIHLIFQSIQICWFVLLEKLSPKMEKIIWVWKIQNWRSHCRELYSNWKIYTMVTKHWVITPTYSWMKIGVKYFRRSKTQFLKHSDKLSRIFWKMYSPNFHTKNILPNNLIIKYFFTFSVLSITCKSNLHSSIECIHKKKQNKNVFLCCSNKMRRTLLYSGHLWRLSTKV